MKKNQAQRFIGREDALMLAIAAAEPDQRPQARLDLARFYMAWGMYQEAKGEAEFILADPSTKAEESVVRMVHAIASICNERRNVVGMMPHPERACEPALGSADGLVMFESVMRALAAGTLAAESLAAEAPPARRQALA